MDSVSSDEVYQDQILPHVSRTFALTIPQLPPALCTPVTNAYLLCRIADTIEDEPALSAPETLAFLSRFSAVVAGTGEPRALARDLESRLSERTLATERDNQQHHEWPQEPSPFTRSRAQENSHRHSDSRTGPENATALKLCMSIE